MRNSFTDAGGDRPRWTVSAEFQFRGLFKLLGPLMRGAIAKRTRADLLRFKTMLEAGQL